MHYTIELVDIKDPNIEERLIILLKEAFRTSEPIPKGHILKNTITTKASTETIFLCAIENGEIIGCCGFMATDFVFNNRIVNGYQAVWAATHPLHQGRRIFVNLINEGKKILKEKGAGFLYALAGDSSYSIFVNRLGFREIPAVMVKIPNVPILSNLYFKNQPEQGQLFKDNSLCPVEEQIIDLKRNTWDGKITEVKYGNSILWGKIETKNLRLGIKLKYFYVGGFNLDCEGDLRHMVNRIFKELSIHYVQFVSCKSNLYNALINNWKPAKMHGFLFYDLNTEVKNINIFYGAIDVF